MNIVLIFSCLLIGWIQCQEPFYIINIPKALTIDGEYEFSIRSSENIKLQITTFEGKSDTSIVGQSYVIEANKSFNVPYAVQFRNIDKLTLKIRADKGEIEDLKTQSMIKGLFINKTIDVPIHNSGNMIFGETSQPLYKPGQLVKFRVFALRFNDLKTSKWSSLKQWKIIKVNGKYVKKLFDKSSAYSFKSIAVINPKKQKMREWTDVNMMDAMDLSYQLLKDPVFGKWKIVAELDGVKETVKFKVKKFVLPRFVVNVKPSTQMLFSDESIKFSVCSEYSTGKPMKADMEGKFCMLNYRKAIVCRLFRQSLTGSEKCSEIKIKTKDLGINEKTKFWKYRYGSIINVTVTEEGTDLSVFKSVKGQGFNDKAYKIEVLSNDYFKPGLPYFGKLKLTKANGEPQVNEMVVIKLRDWSYGNYFGFDINATSDDNGIANFILPITKLNSLTLEIKSVKEYKKPMRSPYKYKLLNEWQSLEKKYVAILKTPALMNANSQFKCPGSLTLSLMTNINLEETADFPEIYVHVFGRGKVQYNGVQKVKLDQMNPCVARDDYQGHFVCLDNGNIECLDGWGGDNCRQAICKAGCEQGVCISPDNCVCKEGWKGNSCDVCIRHPKCKNGYCLRGNDCACNPKWQGRYCDKKGPLFRYYGTTTRKPPAQMSTTSSAGPIIQKQTIFQHDFMVNLPTAIGPDVHIIVYMLTKGGEVIGDEVELQLKNCVTEFGAKDSTKFEFVNGAQQSPGAKVSLRLETGTTRKSCAVRINDVAIDQFGKSSTLDLNSLISDLKRLNHALINKRSWTYWSRGCILDRQRRSIVNKMIMPYYSEYYDTNFIFKKSGMNVITNLRTINSYCRFYQKMRSEQYNTVFDAPRAAFDDTRQYKRPAMKADTSKIVKKKIKKVKEKIRQFFPANWIFQFYNNTPSYLNYTAPDSITTWKANSFCFTEKGLYLSPIRYLKVLQPFYVDLYLPYSIKLTEKLRVPVKVFNYMDTCFEIRAELQVDPREIKITGARSFTMCTCAQQIRTMYFDIEPVVIGEGLNVTVFAWSRYSEYCSLTPSNSDLPKVNMRDAIRRKLRVEAPGVPHESTLSELVCVGKDNSKIQVKGFLELPKDVFPGSLRTYLVVVGNVLGSSLNDLSRLVRLPSGCGEQNMAKTVPAIYVLHFLKATNADQQGDNKALAERTLAYIRIGVRNQKKYQHPDGSYSAFGPGRTNSNKGSTWLTAFVVRSFSAASQLGLNIVQTDTIQKAVNYIASTQDSKTGSFVEHGRLLSSALAGGTKENKGSTDKGLLTSYVAIAIGLAHSSIKTDKIDIAAALKFIRDDLKRDKSTSTYRLALATYAHVINDKKSKYTKDMVNQLIGAVEDEGRFKFWRSVKNSNSKTNLNSYWWRRQFTSADIETTGYAFLAISREASLVPVNFNKLSVVSWLTSQQSSLGGYYSTQDTAVAMLALSIFATQSGATQTRNLSVTVDVNSKEAFKKTLSLKNSLVTNKVQMASEYNRETSVSVKGEGQGCAVVQLVSLYTIVNTNSKLTGKDVFKVSVVAACQQGTTNKAVVKVCSEYLRKDQSQPEGGMVIVTVSLPSGWHVTKEIQADLKKQADQIEVLQNIEFPASNSQRVNLYYRGFTYRDAEEKKQRCFIIPISTLGSIEISNLKPSVVRISDYYRPDLYVDTDYSIPCKIPLVKTTPAPKIPTCPICNYKNSDYYSGTNNEDDEDENIIDSETLADLCSQPNGIMYFNTSLANETSLAWSFLKPYAWNYLEWNITKTSPGSCLCIKNMLNKKQNVLLMTSYYYLSVRETSLKLHDKVRMLSLDNPDVLHAIFSTDISRQCSNMKNVHKILSRKLGYDWKYLDTMGLNETDASIAMEYCPRYLSARFLYFYVKNNREFYCSNVTTWSILDPVVMKSLDNSTLSSVRANLTNGNLTTQRLTLQFPSDSCYALMRMDNGDAEKNKPQKFRVIFANGDSVVNDNQEGGPNAFIQLSRNDSIVEEAVYRYNYKCNLYP